MTSAEVFFMREAVKEAKIAAEEDEIPVGCVAVQGKKIIARAHNQIERLKDPTAHAEMIALTSAANYLNQKWLNEISLFVTIEPCSMCAGAMVLARVKKLIFGASDPKTGAAGSAFNIVNSKKLNHRIKITKGVLKEECGWLLQEFFKKKRAVSKRPS